MHRGKLGALVCAALLALACALPALAQDAVTPEQAGKILSALSGRQA